MELGAPAILFVFLTAASLGALYAVSPFPPRPQHSETLSTIRLAANLFTVMTSLVLGLMITSAKTTFQTVDNNTHVFATDLILLDRSLLRYGADAEPARNTLRLYVQRSLTYVAPDAPYGVADEQAEQLLNTLGDTIGALKPVDERRVSIWRDAQQLFQRLVELRWTLVEQADGTIPEPLLVLLSAWLVLIFASFGYLAPRNRMVVATFVLSALLVSCAVYLILDMDRPYSGPISVSVAPLERAFAEMKPRTG
jgi:hypothetical protein